MLSEAKHLEWWEVPPSLDASVAEFILSAIEGLLSMTLER